jgi:hypothetical protein
MCVSLLFDDDNVLSRTALSSRYILAALLDNALVDRGP